MLSTLTIKNVALIENAEIAFGEGLNVLSGETGAGKSVILDSVNFVLGAKADRSMIRYGETECMVKAVFLVPESSRAVQELRDLDIDTDGEIIISRKFSDGGKNTIKVNGNAVTVGMLRRVTDSLVDVHGQSEHFYLLKESNQLKLLDDVVGAPLCEKKQRLLELLKTRREIEEQIEILGGDEKERERRLDILQFQIDEIVSVDWKEDEEKELIEKRNKINNLEKIIFSVREALSYLSEENSAFDCVRNANRALSNIQRFGEDYENVCDKLENISANIEDVVEQLTDLGDDLYFDEGEAEAIELRLDAIRSLQRKYATSKKELDEYLTKIQAEFELLSDCEGQYALLMEKNARIERAIFEVCNQITALRKKDGEAFCRRVVLELQTLNIPNAQFEIQFNDYTFADVKKANSTGLDEITFLFSANAGEPMKPLGKIISGGEMSRFMLAIKTQLSSVNEISTYIFDEIDAGISGKTAKVVGEKLAKIAKNTQIIAVSHLAQIAVHSDNEFLIEKEEINGKTLTNVSMLNEKQKVHEIVRLLGGNEKDEFAEKHAQELIKQAKEYRNSL